MNISGNPSVPPPTGTGLDPTGNSIAANAVFGVLMSGNVAFSSPSSVPINITQEAGTGNTMLSNRIYGNDGTGNANGAGAIGNLAGNTAVNPAPQIVSAGSIGGQYQVKDKGLKPNTTYTIQIFASNAAVANGGGATPISTQGEGVFLLGTATVTTDANGMATITISNPTNVGAGTNLLSATATDSAGTSSFFSTQVTAGA